MQKDLKCPRCGQMAGYQKYCGAHVCQDCGAHFHSTQNLCQCFCGWRGEDYRKPEQPRNWEDSLPLEDDIGIPVFDGEIWEVDI